MRFVFLGPELCLQLPSRVSSRSYGCCSARGSRHSGSPGDSHPQVTSRLAFANRLPAPVTALRAMPGAQMENPHRKYRCGLESEPTQRKDWPKGSSPRGGLSTPGGMGLRLPSAASAVSRNTLSEQTRQVGRSARTWGSNLRRPAPIRTDCRGFMAVCADPMRVCDRSVCYCVFRRMRTTDSERRGPPVPDQPMTSPPESRRRNCLTGQTWTGPSRRGASPV